MAVFNGAVFTPIIFDAAVGALLGAPDDFNGASRFQYTIALGDTVYEADEVLIHAAAGETEDDLRAFIEEVWLPTRLSQY